MPLHVIRLRGPWEYETISADGGTDLLRGNLQIQDAWPPEIAEAACGIVRLSRRFHRPTGLTAGDRVWLCMGGLGAQVAAALNWQVLEPIGEDRAGENPASGLLWRCDISRCLEASNLLSIDVRGADVLNGGPIADVTLQIDSPGA